MFALPSFVGMFRIRAPNAEASHPWLASERWQWLTGLLIL
jgi:hypothetical protein